MKLAVYNVENLFNRAAVMNLEDENEGRPILDAFAKLNKLLAQKTYTAATKQKIIDLLIKLGLEKRDDNKFVILRQNRGDLVTRPQAGGLVVKANGRADWVGSLDLVPKPINHVSMLNTARVIKEVNPDVLSVVEADSRPALKMFNDEILTAINGSAFSSVMLIDGNDTRGIDVGIATRNRHVISRMVSHVDDSEDGETIFSRDCPEFYITTPKGNEILVMVNHFKSKGFGSPATSNARRLAQARRVRKIYQDRIAEGWKHIVIAGDLNDTPDSGPLQPLHQRIDLTDAFLHPNFDNGGHPGTFGSCTASNKIDYLLLSPDLFQAMTAGGVFRAGMWPGVRPPKWPAFPELTRPVEAGSDHACLWIEVDL